MRTYSHVGAMNSTAACSAMLQAPRNMGVEEVVRKKGENKKIEKKKKRHEASRIFYNKLTHREFNAVRFQLWSCKINCRLHDAKAREGEALYLESQYCPRL